MGEEQSESCIRTALDVHTGDVVASGGPHEDSFQVLLLAFRVLPFGSIEQGECELVLGIVRGD